MCWISLLACIDAEAQKNEQHALRATHRRTKARDKEKCDTVSTSILCRRRRRYLRVSCMLDVLESDHFARPQLR